MHERCLPLDFDDAVPRHYLAQLDRDSAVRGLIDAGAGKEKCLRLRRYRLSNRGFENGKLDKNTERRTRQSETWFSSTDTFIISNIPCWKKAIQAEVADAGACYQRDGSRATPSAAAGDDVSKRAAGIGNSARTCTSFHVSGIQALCTKQDSPLGDAKPSASDVCHGETNTRICCRPWRGRCSPGKLLWRNHREGKASPGRCYTGVHRRQREWLYPLAYFICMFYR